MSFPVTDTDVAVAHEDVFHVTQLTQDTLLAGFIAADLVAMDPGQRSGIHRHNRAETVLYFLRGDATVILDDEEVPVSPGTRMRVNAGVFHGVVSHAEVQFISVQSLPILDQAAGTLDFERREGCGWSSAAVGGQRGGPDDPGVVAQLSRDDGRPQVQQR